MNRKAKVTSIDAISGFRLAMLEYEADCREGVTQLILESHRFVEWLEHDRVHYWKQAYRRASDELAEAKSVLARCELSIDPSDRRACTEEKKAVQKAKRRFRLVEEKIAKVKKWIIAMRQRIEKFEGQLGRMGNFLETELPRAVAALERMHSALEKYASTASSLPPSADIFTTTSSTRNSGHGTAPSESAEVSQSDTADANGGERAEEKLTESEVPPAESTNEETS